MDEVRLSQAHLKAANSSCPLLCARAHPAHPFDCPAEHGHAVQELVLHTAFTTLINALTATTIRHVLGLDDYRLDAASGALSATEGTPPLFANPREEA